LWCTNYNKLQDDSLEVNSEEGIEQSNLELVEDVLIPWHGGAMGSTDIGVVSNKKHPFIIGVVGQAKTGKTTLLATLYMLLRNGKEIGDYQFAGSYTLLGWEKIAHFLSLNSNRKISFPPHTSANMARVPGLLHLKLKDKIGQFQDIIFTDAPGEWFKDWAVSAYEEASKGARWIDENADAFIVVADCEAFNENIGNARRSLLQVVNRMKNTHQKRPTALVWTKSDVELDEDIRPIILDKIKTKLPNATSYDVAVINRNTDDDLENILKLVNQLLTENHLRRNPIPEIERKNVEDFFFLLR